jgi:ferredoxin
MAVRANPRLIDELEQYGAEDVQKCYHCGNCSAVCPFSREPFLFPRKSMRYLQMGLEERLAGNLEPWLCYYCGECSEQCPREAEPGETMMSIRRWLTARYDVTGLSQLFYRSWRAELLAVLLVALLTGAGFLVFGLKYGGGSLGVYAGPGAFLPASAVHVFDWILGGTLAALLAANCARMWWLTTGRDRRVRVPLLDYVTRAYLVPLHFVTQKRYRECESKRPWAVHFVLVASYLTMLVLIMLFLESLHAAPANRLAHAFGYLATAGLLGTTLYALRGRWRRATPLHRHSHETDWVFLVLLVYVATTGILQHALYRWFGLDTAANVVYVAHLMGAVPMLAVEVPFSKWSHLAYRPLAMYFADLHERALARAASPAEAQSAPAAA